MATTALVKIKKSAITLWREEHSDCCPRCHGRRNGVPEFGGCDHDWHHWHKKPPRPPTYTWEEHQSSGAKEYVAMPLTDFRALIKAVAGKRPVGVCMDPKCMEDSDHVAHA